MGGDHTQLSTTIESYLRSKENLNGKSVELRLIVIFNNGSHPRKKNCPSIVQIDINPVASRAVARNIGIQYAIDNNFDFINFIDAGDAIDPLFLVGALGHFGNNEFIVGGYTLGLDVSFDYVPNRNVNVKFRNPFYLSSVYFRTELAYSVRFAEGAKEDWQFWIDILNRNPVIIRVPGNTYYYSYKSSIDHIRRKMKILRGSINFFANNSRGIIDTFRRVLGHYILVGWDWIIARFFFSNTYFCKYIGYFIDIYEYVYHFVGGTVVQSGPLKGSKIGNLFGVETSSKILDTYRHEIRQELDGFLVTSRSFWCMGCVDGYFLRRYAALNNNGTAVWINKSNYSSNMLEPQVFNNTNITIHSDWAQVEGTPEFVLFDLGGAESELLYDDTFVEKIGNANLLFVDNYFAAGRNKDALYRRLICLGYQVKVIEKSIKFWDRDFYNPIQKISHFTLALPS